MILRTERLVLREFEERDLDDLARMYADPEVMRDIADGRTLDRAATWRQIATFIGHQRLRGYSLWAMVEVASGALVGRTGLWNPDGWPGIEAGWLVDRARWGEGFATEAGRAVLDYAFASVRAAHVISLIAPANVASIRVAERLGQRVEGTLELFGRELIVYGVDAPGGARQ